MRRRIARRATLARQRPAPEQSGDVRNPFVLQIDCRYFPPIRQRARCLVALTALAAGFCRERGLGTIRVVEIEVFAEADASTTLVHEALLEADPALVREAISTAEG